MTTETFTRGAWRRRSPATSAGARPRIRPLLIFAFAVILAFFAVIYSRISLDRSAFELQSLENAISVEEAQHWDLRVEVARLHDPDRITRIASGMGLVYPEERVMLEVDAMGIRSGDEDYRWSELRALLSERP